MTPTKPKTWLRGSPTWRAQRRAPRYQGKQQYEIVGAGDYGKTITICVLDELNDEDCTVKTVVNRPPT